MNSKVYYPPENQLKSPEKSQIHKEKIAAPSSSLDLLLNSSNDKLEMRTYKSPILREKIKVNDLASKPSKRKEGKIERSKSQIVNDFRWSPHKEYKCNGKLTEKTLNEASLMNQKLEMTNKIKKIIKKAKDKKKKLRDPLHREISLIISKTLVKDKIHDPITGTIKQYNIDRSRPLSLGNKKAPIISGKINEFSPPRSAYVSARDDKCHQKTINPITGETKESFHTRSISYEEDKFSPPKSAASTVSSANFETFSINRSPSPVDYSSMFNSKKILKGMGAHYQKSNVF
ncbi:unnamed protein product [Blepharisma stoltei]|uniref:Uncharacterized protein n=1 Tax=Blepharisma stoltei TaxID=1481888 RepID=A0AAU9IUK2_9CILI|nr:unnamed protein product [Blepharisma stoltei]